MDSKINSAALSFIFAFCTVMFIIKTFAPIKNNFVAVIVFFIIIVCSIFFTCAYYKFFMAIVKTYSRLNFKCKNFCSKLIKFIINAIAVLIALVLYTL